jgi:putative transposase
VADTLRLARSNLAGQRAEATGRGRRPQPEGELLAEIKQIIGGLPSYGYRVIHALIRRRHREQGGAARQR